MLHFFSKKERLIRKVVKNISKFIVSELKDKKLISLYLAGTILKKKERNHNSDIDFFGIVEKNFNFKLEKEINDKLVKLKNEICEGYESRFRAITITSLQKGKIQKDEFIVKFMRPERLVQRFMFFNFMWGKKFNFKKDFLNPLTLKEEAKILMGYMESSLKAIRNNKETFHYTDFPKHLFELVRVEAQAEKKFKYHPDRHKLIKHLRKEKDHLIHEAWRLRNKKSTRKEIVKFCDQVEIYLKKLKTRIKNWN
ncbi:hypothetical protein HON71_01855 [Candidatus Woesearchaeota archaeon]|jgi:hypothetical protein|nr:hypothetical protein [Candidatus Woesearchaeota archaeon]MBT5342723.1 hypothetical protein [Candidatus Woesearchaeota archaeon]